MSIVGRQLITAEQLLEMPDPGRCELIAGEIKMMTPVGHPHSVIVTNLSGLLWTHVRREGRGQVCSGEPGYLIAQGPDTVRAPDVAYLVGERARDDLEGFFPGAPDLAAEVVSPSDRVRDVQDKAKAWLDAGTRLVWVVWPNSRTVSVYRPGEAVMTLREGETLDGGDVVPGFQCSVSEIFATLAS